MSRLLRRSAEVLEDAGATLEIAGACRRLRRYRGTTVEDAIDFVEHFEYAGVSIRPMQIVSEIRSLLELLASDPPSTVLEIGTGRGGTLFLLARVAREDALLVSIDSPEGPPRFGGRPAYRRRARLYRSLGRDAQRVVFLAVDSHLGSTRALLEHVLGARQLDLLFIDGDHALAGVEADFRLYSPLVRSGGVVALHDIVPGPAAAVGGVPDFWRQLRTSDCVEFVQDWDQGGYGIGVVRL